MAGGLDTGEKLGSKKGKAKMTAAAWAKLTNRQKDDEYGGSRFMRATTPRSKERGKASQRD